MKAELQETTNPIDLLFEQLSMLKGRICWSIIGGIGGTGSHLSLEFEKKVRREIVLSNTNLTLEEREFEGEYHMMIYCLWRIDKDLLPYCGWDERTGKRSPMRRALKQLIGKRITEIELDRNSLDLTLSFEGGYSMKIFTEFLINMDYGDCNYVLFTPLNRYIAYKNAEMGIEEREKFFSEPETDE